MKIRHREEVEEKRAELQMTPMIDIVFQLLVFFVMTFRIVTQEGDFNIKMPLAAESGAAMNPTMLAMNLRLTANSEGLLTGIQLNESRFDDFDQLHRHVIGMFHNDQPDSFRESAEIEIDADYQLSYAYVIEAITAVTGYRTPQNEVVKLVEKIRFAPPKPPPAG